MLMLLAGILGIFLSCLVIMYTCNTCEQSVNYLARNAKPGIKGALFLAPVSSAPELMFMLAMVLTGNPENITAGVATTAGSAIFNGCLIPALSILMGKYNEQGYFKLCRKTLIRDFSFLLVAELVLIWAISQPFLRIGACSALLGIYIAYVAFLVKTSKDGEAAEYIFEKLEYVSNSRLKDIAQFNFNKVLFKDEPLTTIRAWFILSLVVVILFFACHLLAWSLGAIALFFGVPLYFTAVTLGAAATSLPDTVLSIKEAKKGGQDDSVANAFGSNTFDSTVALAFPALLALVFAGASLPLVQDDQLGILRWFIVGSSIAVFTTLYLSANKVSKKTAYPLLAIYAMWIGYLVGMGS